MSLDLEFWTDLADGAIVFPLGVAVPLVLGVMSQRRAAIAWTASIGCVWAVMLVLKLAGYTIAAMAPGTAFSALDLVTPSGHVASSASIYGGLIGLLIPRPGIPVQRAVPAALAIAIGIGTTRVLLTAHSFAEVVVGAVIGIAGAAGVTWAAKTAVAPRARLPIVLVAILIIVAFHGDHTSWEDQIQAVALRLIQLWDAYS